MAHLSDAEVVDLLEGRLPAARASHAGGCDRCRVAVASARDALADAAGLSLPDPSPLFWEHLSSRVREAIDREPAPRAAGARRLRGVPGWAWVSAAALATVIASAALWRASQPAVPPAAQAADRTAGTLPPAGSNRDVWNDDIESDGAWAVVRAVAEDVDWDDVSEAGIAVRPEAAERVVPQLSSEERSELARLIEEELRRNGA